MFCPSPCLAPLPGAFSSRTRLTCCSDLPHSSPAPGPQITFLFYLLCFVPLESHPPPPPPRLLTATESLIALQCHPTTPPRRCSPVTPCEAVARARYPGGVRTNTRRHSATQKAASRHVYRRSRQNPKRPRGAPGRSRGHNARDGPRSL